MPRCDAMLIYLW